MKILWVCMVLPCVAWLTKNNFRYKQISHFGSCIRPLVCAKLGSDLSTDLLEALLLHLGILGEVEHTPQQGCRRGLCSCLYIHRNARLIFPIFSRVLLCTNAAAQAKVFRSTRTEAEFLDVIGTKV